MPNSGLGLFANALVDSRVRRPYSQPACGIKVSKNKTQLGPPGGRTATTTPRQGEYTFFPCLCRLEQSRAWRRPMGMGQTFKELLCRKQTSAANCDTEQVLQIRPVDIANERDACSLPEGCVTEQDSLVSSKSFRCSECVVIAGGK